MAPAFAGYPKVFVVDVEGKPLLPCHPARARKLLKAGKAEVLRGSPFTIRLKYPVENPIGSLRAKVDDGSRWVGIALVNEHAGEVVFRGTLIHRGDVVRLLTLRREYRRNRRYRLVRYRKRRNHNRKQLTPFPSIRQKKEAVYRVLADLAKIVPISGVDVELVVAGVKNPTLPGKGARKKVLNRDGACILCGSEEKLQRHHLVSQSKGGSDTPVNQVVLCEKCHRKIHAGEVSLGKKGRTFAWVAHVVQGKTYLLALLSRFGKVRTCEGWQTKKWRDGLDLVKSHINDAICLFSSEGPLKIFGPEHLIYPLRRRKWESNPTKTCEERGGYQHWDVIRAKRANKVVFGCVRSLKARVMTLRTAEDRNFGVYYSKAKLLHRPHGLAYVSI